MPEHDIAPQSHNGAALLDPEPERPATPPGDLSDAVSAPGRELLAVLARHLPRIRAEAGPNDRDGTFPAETFRAFGVDGVLGATVPAELGGLGVSRLHDVAVALLRVAEADASTALALHAQLSRGITLTYEWEHGAPPTRALAERLLRAMARGEAVVCGAVKDFGREVTRLRPDGAGGWLLSGRKMLVTMAPIATHFVVSAQAPMAGGETLLYAPIVARDTPGLSIVDGWSGLGMRASGTLDIAFDDCPVPAGDVLARGSVGAHSDAALAGQAISSVAMLGIYAGVAQAARDFTVDAVARRSAEAPAASRTLVAEIEARLYTLKATASAALVNIDELSPRLEMDSGERGRRMMTPFQCAKVTVNQLAAEVVDDCVTVVGGATYVAEHPLARLYRDVRAGRFMQPYTYADGVDYLSAQVLGLERDNNYVSLRATRPADSR
ncbi:acyl-CoA/acyl-ACP dehydrogenase [Amycolatopsis sp. OK19-0408]|uniref:Acyl-CoA/acyl-ACP dehydrogenase n=1 Tax=Amycolatopsis iheyensis TaxID=2945988 RepID=A0A9X2SN99_9PSEU|nr:acyl-CoA dehydrogenase family protein [Amycolatopsis iheyensis]MCR6488752.1 acyl-CoA/acyl-ACP dehydrogenase [Amycolatopsis iheyensis]